MILCVFLSFCRNFFNFFWQNGMHIAILKAKLKGKLIDIQANIECRFTLKCVCDMITVKCTLQIGTHNTAESFGQLD